ncbi:MAG: (2Fe-2S) ferredoxin domain-containing protein, partial [Ruminococcus sp.]|nr:(2Fe-2S) ferredoxin domain-containing protein [Ruminococcus sp.]
MFRSNVLVCGGTGCTASGSAKLIPEFEAQLARCGLEEEVKIVRTGCFGLGALGPIMVVYPVGSFYSMLMVVDIPEIV